MPYTFSLPTTSGFSFIDFFTSITHPSLPFAATVHRGVLRNVLKRHKRLSSTSKASNLNTVVSALGEYLPYLLALDAGLSSIPVEGEEIDVVLQKEVQMEWRTCLTATFPGREAPRTNGKGLDYEICFVLNTLACTYTLLAQVQLRILYASQTPTTGQRAQIVTTAMKHLLQANSIHKCIASRASEGIMSSTVVETLPSTQGALASLALAEATLLAVLKDDPYPSVVVQDRNKNDTEWMIKAPEIPKVRAHLFARLCLAAAEHAERAEAMLGSGVNDLLVKYIRNLRKVSRAKACRFFGIDAEIGGETGKGIAWLEAGKSILGSAGNQEQGSRLKGLNKFKKDWTERREEKNIEKGGERGGDAGKLEETSVIEMLEKKWNKLNDTINTQLVPPYDPLIASMPSGREIHATKPFVVPSLDASIIARMRAPPDIADAAKLTGDDDSSSSDEGFDKKSALPGGAFADRPAGSAGEANYY